MNVNTGEILWTFDEDNVRNGNFSYYHNPSNKCIKMENIFFQSGSIGYYFHISTGEYQKFNLNTNSSDFLLNSTCIDEKYFFTEKEETADGFKVCLAYNTYSNLDNFSKLCPLNASTSSSPYNVDGIKYYLPFVEENKVLVFMVYSQATKINSLKERYWNLYNLNESKWVFDNVKIGNSSTTARFTDYYDNRFYINDQFNLYCYSRETAALIWQKEFPAQIDAMNIIEEHNKIVVNCVNYTSYCINADSNAQIWQENSAASTSNIHYQDGVIYFIGGDTGKLHAIDINTGKHIWKITVPDLDGPGSSFSKHVGGIAAQNGKKGKIFTSSFTRAYCFEAVN